MPPGIQWCWIVIEAELRNASIFRGEISPPGDTPIAPVDACAIKSVRRPASEQPRTGAGPSSPGRDRVREVRCSLPLAGRDPSAARTTGNGKLRRCPGCERNCTGRTSLPIASYCKCFRILSRIFTWTCAVVNAAITSSVFG